MDRIPNAAPVAQLDRASVYGNKKDAKNPGFSGVFAFSTTPAALENPLARV
jgi:hypothetical protein